MRFSRWGLRMCARFIPQRADTADREGLRTGTCAAAGHEARLRAAIRAQTARQHAGACTRQRRTTRTVRTAPRARTRQLGTKELPHLRAARGRQKLPARIAARRMAEFQQRRAALHTRCIAAHAPYNGPHGAASNGQPRRPRTIRARYAHTRRPRRKAGRWENSDPPKPPAGAWAGSGQNREKK